MRILPLLFLPALLSATDWPRYRGPNGLGVSPDRQLPSEAGPAKNLVWKTKTPKGNSSPIVVRGRVLFTGSDADQRVVICLDSVSGKELWRKGIAKSRSEAAHPLNGTTTPTPISDGKNVYAFFPEFGVVAYDLDGNEKWRAPMGPFHSIQGLAASPILAGGNVIQLIDQIQDSFVIAFDAKSGRQRWKADRPSGFLGSYSTPVVYKPAKGPEQAVVAAALEMTGYQASTGEKLWWAKGITVGPATLPLIEGDAVYTLEPVSDAAPPFSSMLGADKNKDGKLQIAEEFEKDLVMNRLMTSIDRYNGNKDGVVEASEWDASFNNYKSRGLVKFDLKGKGELPESNIRWAYTKGLPYVTSPLLYQGVLYVIRNGGILTSHNPETGEVYKQERVKDATGDYYASPVGGDGKIYLINKDGKLTVLKSGAQWEVISSADLDEQTIATPAISDGRLFVRTLETVYCFGNMK